MTHNPKDDVAKDTLLAKFSQFFYNNKYSAALILIGLTIIGFSNVVDAGEKIVRNLGWYDKFDINQETPRGKVSFEIIQTASDQIFWMATYLTEIHELAKKDEIERTWERYKLAREKWRSNEFNYSLQIQEYYPGSDRNVYFHHVIQPGFTNLYKSLLKLRYSQSVYFDTPADTVQDAVRWKPLKTKLNEIKTALDDLNYNVYIFIDRKDIEGAKPKKRL